MRNFSGPTAYLERLPKIGAAAVLALLAACAHQPAARPVQIGPAPVAPTPTTTTMIQQPVPDRSPKEHYDLAVQLLRQGRAVQARAELAALLQSRPSDARARQLLREIDTDPHALYGNDSFAYVVRPGDTLVGLARRYLHDPVNFYGLARYNAVTLPAELQPGQTIMIPGRPRPPKRVPAPPRRAVQAASQAEAPIKPEEVPRPGPTANDRVRAQRLRQQGLDQMSAGSIDRAVHLLSQAAVLDPKNGAIAGELARARRIQATVHSR